MECEFCSSNYLLPLFYGITFVTLCTRWYAFPALYAFLLLLNFVDWITLTHSEVFVYTSLGLLIGLCVKYGSHTTRILPKNILRHYHILLVYLFELLLAPFIFYRIDAVVPQTGYPVGIWMSLIFYVAWFILVYNTNFRYEGMLKQPDPDQAFYNQTYFYWFVALLPYYAAALVPVPPLLSVALGFLCLCVLILGERYYAPPIGRPKAWL